MLPHPLQNGPWKIRMDGEDVGRCENLELRCFHTHFKIDMEKFGVV
jgi:hypothetical protein